MRNVGHGCTATGAALWPGPLQDIAQSLQNHRRSDVHWIALERVLVAVGFRCTLAFQKFKVNGCLQPITDGQVENSHDNF